VAVVAVALAWIRLARPSPAAQPASWKIVNNALIVLDRDGRAL
jgi:hypothetical protein